MDQKIEKILVKYLMNAADIDDLEILSNWLKKEENKQIFKNHVKINYVMDSNFNEFDVVSAKEEYLQKIRLKKRRDRKLKTYNALRNAAAVIAIGFASVYLLNEFAFKEATAYGTSTVVNSQIEPGTDKATLTLEDGSQIALEKGSSLQTQNANSNGEEIVYEADKKRGKEVVYNYLTIPRGGQFHVVLSDGTEVWLNSESQLKYPVAFIDGESREVELIYGEAYFDVSPSTAHKGARFKVFNQSQEVEVLGTEFNIKAYKEETNIYTTLVEGKVTVNFGDQQQKLLPNQQSVTNIDQKDIEVRNVDVYGETSWRKGLFSFKSKSLKEIMTVISRWYDVEVIFENSELENAMFNGVLKKDQSLEVLLKAINKTNLISAYEIKEDKVIIK
ncbi:DUF4974 domain-containing protein [Zhouia spongiae]|uniref:DUF4974 domain-containing protein n=1 Tax=Zhouia spongiae TaxID=2202721 RepID=A0ABY3YLR1_9FLAO|nr:FecR family protein [Zhouia spongiae]UNY98774.1 DUF4974 domain-containing protein [Zhouia spongiae]